MPPCISVIMPVRDGARWIGEAIASLSAQTLADFELLVVDDGSTDDTRKIIVAAAQRDPRVRLIAQPPSGIVTALNSGIEAARGRMIARLDADDRAQPARLERQVQFLDAHPDVGLVGSWAEIIGADGTTIGRLQMETVPATIAGVLQKRNPILHSSVMWRAELCAVVGRYRAAFEGAEDYDLWLRMAERSMTANIPEYLVQYRRHADNISHRRKLRQMFSTRLARRAAHGRRTRNIDPTASLTAPPDWNVANADDGFFAEDATLYRFLELATKPALSPSRDRYVELPRAPVGEFRMTHDERRLAQLAILHVVKHEANVSPHGRARLLFDFIRLHPARAIQLGIGHLAERYFGTAVAGRKS